MSVRAQARLDEYRRTGDPAFLEESVRLWQRTLEATPESHRGRSVYLGNLGAVLLVLFEETGESANLIDGAEALRLALATTPRRYRAACLSNLSGALRGLFDQTGELALIKESVQTAREAVRLTSRLSLRRAQRLMSLSLSLDMLFDQTADSDVLAEAVRVAREVVDATPLVRRDRYIRLGVLGNRLEELYEETTDVEILRESIHSFRGAACAVPSAHRSRSGLLAGLGSGLMTLYEHEGDGSALREATDVFAQAAAITDAPPELRVNALRGLAWAAMSADDAVRALASLEEAVNLLPKIAPRALATTDRQRKLRAGASLAAEAASAAIAAGRPGRAVELLEQGRGLLLSETIGARGDLAELRARDAALASEFEQLRDELDTIDSHDQEVTGTSVVSPELAPLRPGLTGYDETQDAARKVAAQRGRLAARWDELLDQIRSLPQLDRFMLPVPVRQLKSQVAQGPVVFVNLSDYRCDALILAGGPSDFVRLVPLSSVTRQDVLSQVRALDGAVEASLSGSLADRIRGEEHASAVLEWLWDEIAEPVLEALEIGGTPREGAKWPRIWWCPVGEMALLPLHAAGYHHHGARDGRAVLERVVSSYTPTVRALQHSRRKLASDARQWSQGALVVALPETPGAPALPGAYAEANLIARLIPHSKVITGPQATRAGVLAALPHHPIVHLSCHGMSDRANPAASALLLYDHADHPLTVARLTRFQIPDAELAFLSACNTSDTNSESTDEAIHITAAFQLAGYRQVVGTLWSVLDDAASFITNQFYTELIREHREPAQPLNAACTLHDAVRKLRAQYPDRPSTWSPFIHYGA